MIWWNLALTVAVVWLAAMLMVERRRRRRAWRSFNTDIVITPCGAEAFEQLEKLRARIAALRSGPSTSPRSQ